MTDKELLALFADRDYDGFSDLEMTIRRRAVYIPEEFPPYFRVRPWLHDCIERGLVQVIGQYTLRIPM